MFDSFQLPRFPALGVIFLISLNNGTFQDLLFDQIQRIIFRG